MKTVDLLSPSDKTVRTQITLTEELKDLVEEDAAIKGQSLSEYLRRAASLTLLLNSHNKPTGEELAKRLIGSIDLKKHPEWSTRQKINKWVRDQRAEWD